MLLPHIAMPHGAGGSRTQGVLISQPGAAQGQGVRRWAEPTCPVQGADASRFHLPQRGYGLCPLALLPLPLSGSQASLGCSCFSLPLQLCKGRGVLRGW